MVDLASMKILRWREVAPIIGCSRMTIARMEKAGDFPKRIRISAQTVGWLEHEVEQWLADRMANRVEDEGAPQDNEIDESMDGDHASALASGVPTKIMAGVWTAFNSFSAALLRRGCALSASISGFWVNWGRQSFLGLAAVTAAPLF